MDVRWTSAVLLLTLLGGCASGIGAGTWLFENPA